MKELPSIRIDIIGLGSLCRLLTRMLLLLGPLQPLLGRVGFIAVIGLQYPSLQYQYNTADTLS